MSRGKCVNDSEAAVGEVEVEPGVWEQMCGDCLLLRHGAEIRWWPKRKFSLQPIRYDD